MDAREERGMRIAATCKIVKKGGSWFVPSQSGKGRYVVVPDPAKPHCTCLDHTEGGYKCKHIFAVEFAMKREENPDGSTTVTKTVTVTERIERLEPRKTYPQVWPAYNEAQTHEKEHFLDLLADLCRGVQEPPSAKTGRPRIPAADAIFAACFKVYSTFSARRFMTDLREAKKKGYIDHVPHFNSIFNALENPALTPILRAMIVEASLPLRTVELDFATDSSGFSTSRFVRWYDHKYSCVRQKHEWVKVHLTCGVKTNVVTAVEIKDRDAADATQLPDLVNQTKQNFTIREMSADSAYSSKANMEAVAAAGGTPFFDFKSSATGAIGGLFQKMFHYFAFRKEEFMAHYHKRSNVESTFGMMKAKFRDNVRSKGDVAMMNEVLCKCVCHNVCVLIQEMYELGIEPAFWTPKPAAGQAAQKPDDLHKNA
jgi:transposase